MGFMRRKPRQRSERWDREDAAPRLSVLVPALTALRLELREGSAGVNFPATASTRHVVVATAGARFEFRCTGCGDRDYDLTRMVLSGLERGSPEFEGTCACSGFTNDRRCERTLSFTAFAAYSSQPT